MCRLAVYFVVLAMVFTYQELKVNARPAPDPCLFGRRLRRPHSTGALREIEEPTVVDGKREKMLQIETLLKDLWYLETSTTTEPSRPDVLNNSRPRTITANNFVERYVQFLGTLFNNF